MQHLLTQKYNVPGPRYTSYPTVPHWDNTELSASKWLELVGDTFVVSNNRDGVSLYIHIPFCEKLCTYCGCNTRITINHAVERVYMAAVVKEWSLYKAAMPGIPLISEIHIGGGTPTFFSPENLQELIRQILEGTEVAANHEFGFEAHPANTTIEHLKVLRDLGFRRISIGVQDFNPEVLEAIHRAQTYEQVALLTNAARELGYTSVNFDLIYGLPLQTRPSTANTIKKVIGLRPDRIALYSYAHVPWVKPGQRSFSDADLPSPELKLELYEDSRQQLESAGYADIGMDHFSLKTDALYIASQQGELNRNFMGYTTTRSPLLIGLGVSAISDCHWAYAQNEKKVEDYYARLKQNELPLVKMHTLSREDLVVRRHIKRLMCQFETDWSSAADQIDGIFRAISSLSEMESDELVRIQSGSLQVLPAGRRFVRNVCMAFDERLAASNSALQVFSSTI